MKTPSIIIRMTAMLFLIAPLAMAADWPAYFGANQDGISKETLNPVWPPEGPKLVWKIPLTGHSSWVVSGNKAFTMTGREKNGVPLDICIAFDAETGKELWAADITQSGGKFEGEPKSLPRTTPTINDGRVYVYSVDMKLFCLDAQTGTELWRVDVMKDHDGTDRLPYKANGSTINPIVDGDLVFVAGGGAGQSILAINKVSGQVVWKTGDMMPSHSGPIVRTIHGERQLVFCLENYVPGILRKDRRAAKHSYNVMGISVKDGKILWSAPPFLKGGDFIGAHPIVFQNRVYFGSGQWASGTAYEIIKEGDGFTAKQIYTTSLKDSLYFTTPVLKDGYLYGTLGQFKVENNNFKCMDFATGKIRWQQKGFGWAGGVILVGDKLVVLADSGELVLVDPKPDAYTELARVKILSGICYGTPAFSNGRVFVRSNTEGACYDLSVK